MRWNDGRIAEGPIALCEVQGYAYQAAVLGADLRYPAIALDVNKKPVDSLTSNIGHLLGTGILDEDGVRDMVARLSGDDMLSGYGVRTMSSLAGGYWPQSYHCGSVWAHDSAIVMNGLRAEGYVDEALRVAEGLVAAAASFCCSDWSRMSGPGRMLRLIPRWRGGCGWSAERSFGERAPPPRGRGLSPWNLWREGAAGRWRQSLASELLGRSFAPEGGVTVSLMAVGERFLPIGGSAVPLNAF